MELFKVNFWSLEPNIDIITLTFDNNFSIIEENFLSESEIMQKLYLKNVLLKRYCQWTNGQNND